MLVQERLYTIEHFEEWIAREDNADRVFELVHGEIIEKIPTEEHSLVCGDTYMLLRLFADPRDLGRVTFEVRRRVTGDDHNARLPDVDFTRKERLLPVVSKGAVPQMPDLVVEVKSPDDSFVQMREKANYYLSNGTQIVWLLFPATREVEVHRNDRAIQVLTEDDLLDGGDVLPGFSVKVSELFRSLGR